MSIDVKSARKFATAAGKRICTVREASDARRRIYRFVTLPKKYLVWRSGVGKLIRSNFFVIFKASLLDQSSDAGSPYLGTLNQV